MADEHVYTFFLLRIQARRHVDRSGGTDTDTDTDTHTHILRARMNESHQGKIRLNTFENTMRQIINIRTQHGKET